MADLMLRRHRYFEWLSGHGLRFGFPAEIADLCLRTRDGVRNDVPPLILWHNILPTARLVEKVRERFGATTINSAYRSPMYNAAVKGEKNSMHMKNFALDFFCATGTPAQWLAFLHELRRAGEFKGGLGIYPTFVHVDTRGSNADWDET